MKQQSIPKPLRPHEIRGIFDRDPNTMALTIAVMAECDKPNAKRRVNELTAEFVEDFGQGTYRRVAAGDRTGETVHVSNVCRNCVAAKAKRAAGPKPRSRKAA